jgi:hypothetical protein
MRSFTTFGLCLGLASCGGLTTTGGGGNSGSGASGDSSLSEEGGPTNDGESDDSGSLPSDGGCALKSGTCVLCDGKWNCSGSSPTCPPGARPGGPCAQESEGCYVCNSNGIAWKMLCQGEMFEATTMPCSP